MKKYIIKQILSAFLIMVVLTVILGLIYPFVVMGVGKIFFSAQANGSLVEKDGKIIGSKLIQQEFTSDEYFHGRPARIGPDDYPTSKKMIEKIESRAIAIQKENSMGNKPVPVCLVTDSGSSLDPDISIDAAYYQVKRIAEVRDITVDAVNKLIAVNKENRVLGLLGENRVNVLQLNMALDKYCDTK
jgi:potassium-transporting ATPase KdpC subunit